MPTERGGGEVQPRRLGLVRDFAEENWPSMDLCAEMLAKQVAADQSSRWVVVDVCPPFRRRLQKLPLVGSRRAAFNADRLVNRLWDYPRHMAKVSSNAEVFHIVDHSYSQLVHALPAKQTGVFCHDLDTFRCVLHPELEPRPRWFRRMTGRILEGLRKAAVVFHTTETIRQQILDEKLVEPARLVKAPYGMADEFRLGSDPVVLPGEVQKRLKHGPMLLHVGSCIARKRIDVLLNVFAELRKSIPEVWLVQAGGEWSAEQAAQIDRLRIADGIVRVGRQARGVIAELYRQAAVVLMPSEAEGFGLPVAEAMACGAIVVTSDIPVFREVGGGASVYAPLANIEAWSETLRNILARPELAPSREIRLNRASHYTWQSHAAAIVGAYEKFV